MTPKSVCKGFMTPDMMCVTDLNGLPSKEGPEVTQKLSTGSASSSTSMPRARAASSFGLDFSRSALSPTR